MTRREWLRLTFGAAGVGALDRRLAGAPSARPVRRAGRAAVLRSFVDPLPIPPVLRASPGGEVTLRLRTCRQQVHRDLPPTELWGYDGHWPGPTIEAAGGRPLLIRWVNDLPTRHFLPIDSTIHGAGPGVPAVRAVTHVHGARALPDADGHPEAWSTADGQVGPTFRPGPYRFGNEQPAATLWYHDHALGITRLNVYAGLAGLYLIRDDAEAALQLPSGAFEIPLLIQDRSFNPDGSLRYPAAEGGPHPVWVPECFGDVVCVNGKVAPVLTVEPRRYRLRLVNGSNARFYRLTLLPADREGEPAPAGPVTPALMQIGTDGGLLPAPVRLRTLILAPGERADLVVDFTDLRGARFLLANDAPAPYVRGGAPVPRDVLLIAVDHPLSGPDDSRLPARLVPMAMLDPPVGTHERILPITETERMSDGATIIGLLGNRHWMDPVTEDPQAGSLEVWTFANTTGDVHPIHTHLTRFQVLNRQRFDVRTYLQTGTIVPTSPPLPPDPNERPAWKDTVKTYPGYLTRIVQRFDPPVPAHQPVGAGDTFAYVWHCHVLEHEDNEMMRPYLVRGPWLGPR